MAEIKVQASPALIKYFESIQNSVEAAHKTASEARAKGYDPDNAVEVKLAANMAERVVGLISVVAPQIVGSGVVERIIELEKQYGSLDWRVGLVIAGEIAQQKFCKFKTQLEAMDVGIRTGFAYATVGAVSAPLDGMVGIEIKDRMDKAGKYMCINFAGPVRGAGGTGASVCVLIADYVRSLFGYATYDAQDIEIKRAYSELVDYRERGAPRQYFPSFEEIDYLLKHMPVEVGGEPSEKFEVSNYKDLPRIPTNIVRGGFCLIYTDCIPLKAPKLWKQLGAWGKDLGMSHWSFLEEFLKIQKAAKAKGEVKKGEGASTSKLMPDFSYIADLVAGRPVFAHPLRTGGFRLRYGRSRMSGLSTDGIHPATMLITTNYLATGTQLKTERPKKGCAITACDTIDGPIVRLDDGSVVQIQNTTAYKAVQGKIAEILFLGDILVNYGDFANRAHALVPAGYCPEWWTQELEKAANKMHNEISAEKISASSSVPIEMVQAILNNPLRAVPPAHDAIKLSTALGIPLHPAYTYYWSTIQPEQLKQLVEWMDRKTVHLRPDGKTVSKLVLPRQDTPKRVLELIGLPHTTVMQENVVVESDHAQALLATLGWPSKNTETLLDIIARHPGKNALELVNLFAPVPVRDKAGTFIGARMGRPEKAKMRKLTGSPHCLFPVGDEGGKFRSFQSATEKGTITAEFPKYACEKCNRSTVLSVCETCDLPTKRMWQCRTCNSWISTPSCPKHGEAQTHIETSIDAKRYFNSIAERVGMHTCPELIKGVKGTSNKEHIPEHLAKGLLRAKHEITVNKDGTTRYDMTQLPVTHFKPKEIRTPIKRLKELGYVKDINGKPLESDEQVVEIRPQDIILPDCDASPDEGSAAVLMRIANFIDDELSSLYKLQPFYSVKKPEDLVGHLVVALAPHTSAGTVCRIIGFSKTQGFFAHPYMHAATRRDCDGDEACVILLMDAFLNFSKKYLPSTRGSTMDAPLVLTSILTPAEVDDMVFDIDIVSKYPLELYEAALQYKMPWDIKLRQIKSTLNKPEQYEGFGFTHDITDMNETVRCSAYKTLPSMEDKLKGQMELAEKLRAVDMSDVARLVIEKHFLKDTKGNLRKFGMQEFRCVNCNEKFRRPPLAGKCTACGGKILFTISEGSVIKYLEPTISLAKKYNVSKYLQQAIELLQFRIEGVFGKEKDKQMGLGAWFG
ncbi:MAG: DNA polymerase II large subunit [Candidatus Woesearchaeota archaeon]